MILLRNLTTFQLNCKSFSMQVEVGRTRATTVKPGVASEMQLRESVCIRALGTQRQRELSRAYLAYPRRRRSSNSCNTYERANRSRSYNNTPTIRVGQTWQRRGVVLYSRGYSQSAFKFAPRNGETRFSYCLTSLADTIMETRVIALFSSICNSISQFVRSRGRLINSDFIWRQMQSLGKRRMRWKTKCEKELKEINLYRCEKASYTAIFNNYIRYLMINCV